MENEKLKVKSGSWKMEVENGKWKSEKWKLEAGGWKN
jgi:hypothetical protein